MIRFESVDKDYTVGSVFEGFSLAEQQQLLAIFGRLYTAMGGEACQEEIRT